MANSYRPVPARSCSTASLEYFCCKDDWREAEAHCVRMARIDGYYTGQGGYNNFCVDTASVLSAYPDAVFLEQNAYHPLTQSNGNFVTTSVADHRKTGWKSVLAAKTHHGKLGWARTEKSGSELPAPDCGALGCTYFATPTSTPAGTKYLSVTIGSQFLRKDGFEFSINPYRPGYGTPTYLDGAISSYTNNTTVILTVDRYSGVIENTYCTKTETTSSGETWKTYATESANRIADLLQYDWGFQFPNLITNIFGDGWVTTYNDTYLNASYYDSDDDWGFLHNITIELGTPYTEAECMGDTETLLNYFPLDDDIMLQWRRDELFSIEPYVCYNESITPISPKDGGGSALLDCGWTDPNALRWDGRVLGTPLPSNILITDGNGTSSFQNVVYDPYYDGNHNNYELALIQPGVYTIQPSGLTGSQCPWGCGEVNPLAPEVTPCLGAATQWTPDPQALTITGQYYDDAYCDYLDAIAYPNDHFSGLHRSPFAFKGGFRAHSPDGRDNWNYTCPFNDHYTDAGGPTWPGRMIVRKYAEVMLFTKPSYKWCRPYGLYDLSQSFYGVDRDCTSDGSYNDIVYDISGGYYVATKTTGGTFNNPSGDSEWYGGHPSGSCTDHDNGYWNDEKRKYEYVTTKYEYNFPEYYLNRFRRDQFVACNSCDEAGTNPDLLKPQTGPLDIVTSTTYGFSASICNPSVVVFQPSSSNKLSSSKCNAVHYDLPDISYNWIGGYLVIYDVQQWMPDPLFQRPVQTCQGEDGGELWAEDTNKLTYEGNNTRKLCVDNWTQTIGNQDWTYYPMRDFYEAVTSPPNGNCDNLTNPGMVGGARQIGCSGVVDMMNTLTASCNSTNFTWCNPICGDPTMARLYDMDTDVQLYPWSLDMGQLNCINAAERWAEVYTRGLAFAPTVLL